MSDSTFELIEDYNDEYLLAGRDKTISKNEVTIADFISRINMFEAGLQGK